MIDIPDCGMDKIILTMALTIACSACASYDTSKLDALLKNQSMIIFSETGEHRVNQKHGFVIYMKPAEAYKINAPNSPEFHNLLNARLSIEEAKNGRRFCENGYRIISDYTYYFVVINAECN